MENKTPLYSLPGSSPSIDGHLMELCLTAVKFARKKGNIALASRLLSQCSDRTQAEDQTDELSKAFRRLTLEGTLGEKWGPELQIEKAKVLRASGEEQETNNSCELRLWGKNDENYIIILSRLEPPYSVSSKRCLLHRRVHDSHGDAEWSCPVTLLCGEE